jgi:superfamily I DNA/RNA helicase
MIPDFHERPREFYDTLEPRVLQELARREDTPTYDLILVDEGQDFSRRMIEVLVRLRADGGEITVVCDPAQDLYGRWSEDNLAPLRGVDVEYLVDCYRNTAPIYALAMAVLPSGLRERMGLTRLGQTRPEDVERQGPPPELVALPGLDDLADLVERTVRDLDAKGVPLSDLAILYTDREAIPNFGGRLRHSRWPAREDPAFGAPDAADPSLDTAALGTLRPSDVREEPHDPERGHFARALEEELARRGVLSEWITRDYSAKAAYDISKSRLTISTVHSAKGMDFHTVIFLGAESLGAHDARAAELVFTAVTRAREALLIPYFLDRGWIPELRARLEEGESEA